MNTLCHKRIGRRFIPVPDYTGYFYSYEHGFTKEKMLESFAIVVSQNTDVATLAFLEHSNVTMAWKYAKQYCETHISGGYMPSLAEVLQAIKYKKYLQVKLFDKEWTSTEYTGNYALYLYWHTSEIIDDANKYFDKYVRPFFKLNVLTREYV